jgi:hypothetical protein
MKIKRTRVPSLAFLSGLIIPIIALAADGSSAHAGHGIGSALLIRVNQQADYYAFLFDQLGMQLPQNSR